MTIQFDGTTAGQQISFGDGSPVEGLALKTFDIWYYKDTAYPGVTTQKIFEVVYTPNTIDFTKERTLIYSQEVGGTKQIFFYTHWSAQAFWGIDITGIANGWHHLVISYDTGSTANVPAFYLDNVSKSIFGSSGTPSGSWSSSGATVTAIGSGTTGSLALASNIARLNVYNRILSTTERTESYNSRKAIPTYNGLVFAPQLNGAAGLQTFGGATLAAGNTIVDSISGAIGTPAGSPVGVGDTYLTYGSQ